MRGLPFRLRQVYAYCNLHGLWKLTIEPATEEEIKKSSESGTTRDGKTWKSSGNQIVVDNKKVTVNENKKNKNN